MFRHGPYPQQTILQHRNGYIFVKQKNGKWIGQGRFVMQQTEGRDLEANEYVFHKDGDRANNEVDNLVIIRKSNIRYHLKQPKILYMPKVPIAKKRELVAA